MGMKLQKKKQGLAVLLSAVMVAGSFASAFKTAKADETAVYEKQGSYSYSTIFNKYTPETDTYYYTDACFMRSSYLGCDHLNILSVQAAAASGSYYGENGSTAGYNTSEMSKNITDMLTDMGFENVKVNAYYSEEKLADSIGVAVGTRKITQDGKEYTLIAVIPRSSGYRMEWEGDFVSGSGEIHSGLKSARDEVLRFVKNYISDNGISGDLKFWIAGHSRGGAVSNLTAGFLADGGAAYLGNNISVTPENIYCYTYAAPNCITDGTKKATALSVEGARGGIYSADSSGAAYTSTASGNVSLHDECFNGIRNTCSGNDLVAKVLPAAWGYDKYGQALTSDADGKVTAEEMIGQLVDTSPAVAAAFYNQAGDFREFSFYNVNLDELKLVKDTSASAGTMEDFEETRLAALTTIVNSKEVYATGGAQEILATVAALAGLLADNTDVKDVKLNQAIVVEPIAYSILAFSCERYIADGKAKTEEEAVQYVIADAVEFLTGKKVSPATYTVDDLFKDAAAYFCEHQDNMLGDKAFTSIEGLIPENIKGMIPMLFGGFSKKYSDGEEITLRDALVSYLYACAYGAEEGSTYHDDPDLSSAYAARRVLFMVLPLVITGIDSEELEKAIGTDEYCSLNGSAPISKASSLVYSMLLTVKDKDKNDVTLNSLSEVADFSCSQLLDAVAPSVIKKVTDLYGKDVGENIRLKLINVKQNITLARRVLCYGLFYNPGENYSISSAVRTAATLAGNGMIIPVAHAQETYIAWARACAASGNGLGVHDIAIPDLVPKTEGGGKRRDSSSATGDYDQMIYLLMMLSASAVFGSTVYVNKRKNQSV